MIIPQAHPFRGATHPLSEDFIRFGTFAVREKKRPERGLNMRIWFSFSRVYYI